MKTAKLILLLIVYSLLSTTPAQAGTAVLFLSPSSGSYTVGQTFSVRANVSSGGEYINAVAAYLSYPADKLEATGVDTGGSTLSIWAEKTAGGGAVRLSGGLPTPGFNGEGLVAEVSFRVKETGLASLQFTADSAVVRDSDNQDILADKFGAEFSLATPAPTPTATLTPKPVVRTQTAPTLQPTATPPPLASATPIPTATPLPSTTPMPTPLRQGYDGQVEGQAPTLDPTSFLLGFVSATLVGALAAGGYLVKKKDVLRQIKARVSSAKSSLGL